PPAGASREVAPGTAPGGGDPVTGPLPSCPRPLDPEPCIVPSDRAARVWYAPLVIATALAIPFTATGTADGLVVPWPSSPLVFPPQHLMDPSLSSAHAWLYPLATAATPVRPATTAGFGENVVNVPSPRWPDSPSPQH